MRDEPSNREHAGLWRGLGAIICVIGWWFFLMIAIPLASLRDHFRDRQ